MRNQAGSRLLKYYQPEYVERQEEVDVKANLNKDFF
jgi:hypothetical protein